ncbi:MAG TPA: trypsin-like serine protease [Solirubrobacteraceae bacterium]
MWSRRAFLAVLVVLAGATPAAAAEPKIVGGTVSANGAYPAQAELEIERAGGAALCGGTLVAFKKIVTAAHCVAGVSAQDVTVRLGSNELGAGMAHAVEAVAVDPAYDDVTFAHDVAVLTLAQAATQMPLALLDPASDVYEYDVNGRVLGWGATADGGPASAALREVDVPLVADLFCGAAQALGSALIADVMICAGLAAGGKDSCQGDSGGPLMFNSDGMHKLLGVVSWGDGCALPDRYGVYTELPDGAIRQWLLSQIGLAPALAVAPVTDAVVGKPVTLHAEASDPDGLRELAWDLDADGQFDDATGADPSWTPPRDGPAAVRARAIDDTGLVSATERAIAVLPEGAAPPVTPPAPPPPATATPATTTPAPAPAKPVSVTPRVTTAQLKLSVSTYCGIVCVSGRVKLSGQVVGKGCAGGTVRVTLSHGGKRFARKDLRLGADCAFRRSFKAGGRVKVVVRFLGTASLGPVSLSRTRRVH